MRKFEINSAEDVDRLLAELQESGSRFDALHKQWIEYRAAYRAAKRERDYQAVIDIGSKIIAFADAAPDLKIHVPTFEKGIADARAKLQKGK